MSDDIHADVTINNKTKVPLGLVASGAVVLISVVSTVVLWAAHIQSSAAQNAIDVATVKQDVMEMKTDMKNMSQAQIRMETVLGIAPKYTIPKRDNEQQ